MPMLDIRRFTSALATLGVVGLLSVPAASRAELSYDDWTERALKQLENTPQAKRYRRSVERARAAIREARRQSPWQTTTTLRGQKKEERPDLGENTPPGSYWPPFVEWDARAENEIQFDHRSGFRSLFSGAVGYNVLQKPVQDGDGDGSEETGLPYNASLEFNYDVVRGGPEGLLETREEIQVLQARRQWANAAEQWLQSRIEFIRVITRLFRNACALQIVDEATGEISPRVKEARAKAEANQISQTDFLNFLDLRERIRRRKASRLSQRQDLTARLGQWGDPQASKLIEILERNPPTCAPRSPAFEGALDDHLLTDENLERVAASLPNLARFQIDLERSMEQVRLRELQNQPGLRPFVRGALQRQPRLDVDEQSYWRVLAGLRLNWELPYRQGIAGVTTRKRELATARSRVATSRQRQLSTLERLQSSVRSQQQVLDVLRSSMQSSEKLLEALRAQETAGVLDSLNFANAYLNYVTARLSAVESWTSIKGALRRLEEYRRWSDSEVQLGADE